MISQRDSADTINQRDSADTMKIISFGDVHMATSNLERMDEVMRATDLVIISGDLTNFGGEADARKVIDEVRRRCPTCSPCRATWTAAR